MISNKHKCEYNREYEKEENIVMRFKYCIKQKKPRSQSPGFF